jgi:type II secretory pathway pseudopilin PulG
MLFCARKSRGFTLIDIMAALVIVGTAIAAVMHFMASSTSANATSGRSSVAIVLSRNLYEYALTLDPGLVPATHPSTVISYVAQLNGQTFSPAKDARGVDITNMPGWSQRVQVTTVNRLDLTSTAAVTATADAVRRLQVTVLYRGRAVYDASWILARSTEHY